jgi:Tfp pilus assembly protein PilV
MSARSLRAPQQGFGIIEMGISLGLVASVLTGFLVLQNRQSLHLQARKDAENVQSFKALATHYIMAHATDLRAATQAADNTATAVRTHCRVFGDVLHGAAWSDAAQTTASLSVGSLAVNLGDPTVATAKHTCAFDMATLIRNTGTAGLPVASTHCDRVVNGVTVPCRHVVILKAEKHNNAFTGGLSMLFVQALRPTTGTALPTAFTGVTPTHFQADFAQRQNGIFKTKEALGESGGFVPSGNVPQCTGEGTGVQACGTGWSFPLTQFVDGTPGF